MLAVASPMSALSVRGGGRGGRRGGHGRGGESYGGPLLSARLLPPPLRHPLLSSSPSHPSGPKRSSSLPSSPPWPVEHECGGESGNHQRGTKTAALAGTQSRCRSFPFPRPAPSCVSLTTVPPQAQAMRRPQALLEYATAVSLLCSSTNIEQDLDVALAKVDATGGADLQYLFLTRRRRSRTKQDKRTAC